MSLDLESRLRKVKIIVSDVDGVFTDGSIYLDSHGQELKRFHVHDGAGIALVHAIKFPFAVISGRQSEATYHRMKELGLEQVLFQGNLAKLEPYAALKTQFGVLDEEVAYIGDDIIDIPLLRRVGFPVAVANALPEVKRYAVYVTEQAGGAGAVREVINLVLSAQDKLTTAIEILTKDKYKDI
jgi:3-deoxy-D-manno-octulosonate 8-phosphate phosphatase (KDO 8-P phosphatase)